MEFYSSGHHLFLDSTTATSTNTTIHEDDSETMIKELLETQIRPAVQDDGILKLKMQGACSGCPSSSVTLKSGIENMLMHYVPESGPCLDTCTDAGFYSYQWLLALGTLVELNSFVVKGVCTCFSSHPNAEVKGVERELDNEDEDEDATLAGNLGVV
ncbi:NFU1 iron-sulfur cluster scaffold-like protein [Hibiscus syriacus]|uniref:NFU1 iron-sulfur cluster scaffold-like protein n=1 Tax=Hibiscus syriacus TaxID=106335 RepID=A0A6A2YRQ5_HIBSY|nr:NFU1 iron-sulfur cluster scaffold-like protein [Hibiscus syriacus]